MSTLLVCSGGGHLKQLFALASRIGVAPEDQVWVTFENGLSRSILADREVVYAPFAGPRDAVNIGRIALLAFRMLQSRRFDRAISTGIEPGRRVPAARGGAGHAFALHRERRPRRWPVDERTPHLPCAADPDVHPVPRLVG